MTATTLRSYTCKDLAQMARKEGVPGWHAMRKDELVRALLKVARKKSRPAASSNKSRASRIRDSKTKGTGPARINSSSTPMSAPHASPARRRAQRRISQLQHKLASRKNISTPSNGAHKGSAARQDRLVVMVRDPYWLHAYWELTPQSVERARSSLGQKWHGARPVLRLNRLLEDGSSAKLEREVEIHGGVNNWYLDVSDPSSTFRVEIGYASGSDFYCIARSNAVTTPIPGSSEAVDRNWTDVAENVDRIFAMSGGYSPHGVSAELQELLEERLHRRLGRPSETRFGSGAAAIGEGELRIALDAELVVYGATVPHAHVTIKGEPVKLRPDGTFAVRIHLPDRRQVIPVVANSADGVEQKTIILGLERNTKELETVIRDGPGREPAEH